MQALEKTSGNKKQAADMLGLKRTTLSAKLRILDAGE
jgi:DNA-binding protein Fis